MSEFDRRTGVKHLRVRGMKAVRFCVFLKAAGLNILRAAAFRVTRNKNTEKHVDISIQGLFPPIGSIINERLRMCIQEIGSTFQAIFEAAFADDGFLYRATA